jgi:alkanesulfonate monooxygenase SsuD/methylene tetrahydromethanopterin reductase-like flavin-dependent oxidoreductase (luciferase family)
MIGGDGEKLTLRVVARHADWWNAAFLPADEYARKLAALEKHCAAEKRDPAAIKKTHFAFISLSENPDRLIHRDDLYVTAGSPDAVTRELEQFRALGVEHVMIRFLDFPQTEGLELFLRQILPRLK